MPGFFETNDKIKTKYLEILCNNIKLIKTKSQFENNIKNGKENSNS